MVGAAVASVLGLPASAGAEPVAETVVVTGSRIPTTDVTSPSPLSVTTADQINLTKAVDVEDVLQKMIGPDTVGTTNSNTENGSVGLQNVSLRGLGPQRTLVLVDGQRLMPVYVGTFSAPDLSSIPLSMVERIEVLRDGASSIYGADAIGGVVNIITRKHDSGLTFNAGGGLTEHGGAESYNLGATLGLDTDRGNIMISVDHDHINPLFEYQRSWSSATTINGHAGSVFRTQLPALMDNDLDVWIGGVQHQVTDPGLSLPCSDYVLGRLKFNAGCNSAQGPYNTLNSGETHDEIALNSHYDITPDVTFIASGFYTDRKSFQSLRPEPMLGAIIATFNYQGFFIGTSYPGYSSAPITDPDLIIPASANGPCHDIHGCFEATLEPIQFGPRKYSQDSQTYRIRTGFEGHLFTDYNWELGFVKQSNTTDNKYVNEGRWDHWAEMTGQIPCTDVPGGCTFDPNFGYATPTVKPNFFAGPNMFTPAQVAYLTAPSEDYLNTASQDFFYGDINGPIFELPAGTLKGSLGIERRWEHLSSLPPQLVQDGFGPNASLPTAGGYSVWSAYIEFNVPVLKGLPFAESVTFTPSARFDHYDIFGDAKTYKFAADWQVTDDVRIRGTYATGFRAPTTAELFGGAIISDIGAGGDPCDSRAPGFAGNPNIGQGLLGTGSKCSQALAGVAGAETAGVVTNFTPAGDNQANGQLQVQLVGSTALKPELSHSFNVGFVATPTFLSGFTATVDYYEVSISNAILTGGLVGLTGTPDVILLGCYGPAQDASKCALVHRNGQGVITQIDSPNLNFGKNEVKGMDMPVPGSFVFDVQAQRDFLNTTQNLDGSLNSFIGTFAGLATYPAWRGTLSIDYTLDDLTLHWDSQYFEHVTNFGGGVTIPDYVYHNISVAYDFDNVLHFGQSRIVFGVSNLFDKDPPFLGTTDPTGCKCNSLGGGPYDVIGRNFFLHLTTKY
jgi:iron complex outermembrane recepter protein